MNVIHGAMFACSVLLASLALFAFPAEVHAAVHLDDSMLSRSLVMKKAKGPYYVEGDLHVPKGVNLRVDSGTDIVFNSGTIYIEGDMEMNGTSTMPVRVSQDSQSNGFILKGGTLAGSSVRMTGGLSAIQAYASSTVLLSDFSLSDVSGRADAVMIWQDSILDIKNSSFSNISSLNAISAFNSSSLFLDTVRFADAGLSSAVSVYDSPIATASSTQSSARIEGVTFESDHKERQGLEVFNGAFAEIGSSSFSGFSESGISAYTNGDVYVVQSAFLGNKNGISSYGANVTVSGSEFLENSEHGAVHVGGSFDAADNWWGDSSGPYEISRNKSGTGDSFSGTGNIVPWLTERQNKPCCSNILFIPGLKGSRIYKKQAFSENQLWEPNGNADVKKMFLDKNGNPIDISLYVKDIIGRTNITFGGAFDYSVYDGIINALNGLTSNFSIRDWEYAAYDWRMSPNTVAVAGSRTAVDQSSGKTSYRYQTMLDQITRLAKTSRTGKVTLLAHSYGGLVAKRLISYLADKGLARLVDRVIFVATPDEGSPSSLFALLHGDNQDMGLGFILNKQTARSFALNMPSTYALLPTADARLIDGRGMKVDSVSDMRKFLLDQYGPAEKEGHSRPSSSDPAELNVPAVGNAGVLGRVDLEGALIKNQDDPAFNGIGFYSILGNGIETAKSITYEQSECVSAYGTITLKQSKYCGLDHSANYSKVGDGTVLLGDMSKRWGDAFIIDLGAYNAENSQNYSHGNMMSASPVISTIMQIETDHIGRFQLPKYVSHHGSSSGGAASVASSASQPKATYQVLASDSVSVSAVDEKGNVFGAALPDALYADLEAKRPLSMIQAIAPLDYIPVSNVSPNSSYGTYGSRISLMSESVPEHVALLPNISSASSDSQSGVSGVSKIDIEMRELMPESATASSASSTGDGGSEDRQAKTLFSFSGIPITEYSVVEMSVDLSSSTPAALTVRDNLPGVYAETRVYAPDGFIVATGTSSSASSGTVVFYISGRSPMSARETIEEVRTSIMQSHLRPIFKERYLLRLNAIEKYGELLTASGNARARSAVSVLLNSFQSMLKDMTRFRPLFYTGGMSRAEAVFLLSQFSKLSGFYQD